MSKQFENLLVKEIDRATDDEVRAHRCGYSGNNATPQPDIIVRTPTDDHAAEVKKSRGRYAYIDQDDLEQIVACTNSYTYGYLVLKFQRYEPIVVRYYADVTGRDEWDEMTLAERFSALTPEEIPSKTTDHGSLRITNPKEVGGWPSTRGGRDDTTVLLDRFGIPHEGAIEL